MVIIHYLGFSSGYKHNITFCNVTLLLLSLLFIYITIAPTM